MYGRILFVAQFEFKVLFLFSLFPFMFLYYILSRISMFDMDGMGKLVLIN